MENQVGVEDTEPLVEDAVSGTNDDGGDVMVPDVFHIEEIDVVPADCLLTMRC